MEDNEQVVTDEQAQTETAEVQQEQEQVEVDWKARAEELQKSLDSEKSRAQGLDRKVTELRKQNVPVDELKQEVAYLSEAIKTIVSRVGAGYEGSAPLEAELQRLEAQKAQAMNMLAIYNGVQTEIIEELEDAGISLDSPEAQKILSDFNTAKQAKSDPRPLIKEAKKIVRGKMKAASSPDIDKLTQEITERVRKEFLEGKKQSPALKVDTGGTTKGAGSFDDIEAKFSRGEVDYKTYEDARKKRGLT